MKHVRKLCSPAYVYLVISVISLILMVTQNIGNSGKYCIGSYECQVDNIAAVFVGKALYIAFWTFVLNSVCKAGFTQFSWFLLFFPYVLFFVLIGLFVIIMNPSKLKTSLKNEMMGELNE